ncbi:uncharacterized protein LOC110457674 [Mizuhopecten yessoensis]|uniref:uncharacterized protein LOC110457674 n=1 Tax=Mizuhopecten yessoensis TaxID=6573 RepID=UPI000B45A26C|nr:uncharacterized protein LOC110457674 [Mizuhopecten yessoensis]
MYILLCEFITSLLSFFSLDEWRSTNRSEADLENILKSFEDLRKTAYIWPDILEKIQNIHQKCEGGRWPAILLDIFHFMVRAVQLFNTRLGEARAAPNMGESSPLVDRLSKMKSSLKDILETKTIIQDLVVVNITVDLVGKTDEEISLQRTEHRETDIYCLTKRPVGRLKDLLIKNSLSTNILDLNDGTEESLVSEVDGEVNIIISHDAQKSYKSYRVHLKEGDEWTRLSATLQNNRLCVTGKLPPTTMVFFTSMKNDTKTTLNPDQENIHICPENNDVVLEFSKETVKSPQEIQITLRGCKFPLSEIAGYSDIVCIQHEEKFLKPVTVTMPMTMLGENDIEQCDLFCVHIGDDRPTINKDVKVEILSGNVCRFETVTFGWNVLHARKKIKEMLGRNPNLGTFSKQLHLLHDPGPHRIILFICRRFDDDTWQVLAEVVSQAQIDHTIEKRRKEMALFELCQYRSPSLIVSGIQQIAILGENCSLSSRKGAPTGGVVIKVIRGGEDNFIKFVVTFTGEKKMGTVLFQAAGIEEHSAFFDQEDIDKINRFITSQRIASSESLSANSEAATPDTSISTMARAQSETETVPEKFFGDKSMHYLIKQIAPDKMLELAISLGIGNVEVQDLRVKHSGTPELLRLNIITRWLGGQTCSDQERVETLCKALEEGDLKRIADIVVSVFKKSRPLEKTDFE